MIDGSKIGSDCFIQTIFYNTLSSSSNECRNNLEREKLPLQKP